MLPLWTSVTDLALVLDGVLDGGADQPFAAFAGNGFDADAARGREPDFLHAHFLLQESDELLRFGRFGGPFDAGVNVLGVLAEDDHVHLFGMLDGRGDAFEPAHGSQANVEVEHLTQRDVQAADAFADGRGQRAFDADEIILERLDRLIGEPVLEFLERGLPGKDFQPFDLAFAAVSLFYRRVEHAHGRRPDVRPRAVAADEGQGGIVRNIQLAVLDGNLRHSSCVLLA